MSKLAYLLCVILCILTSHLNAQQTPSSVDSKSADFTKISSRLTEFMLSNPQEKIHVHFNKDSYSLGDTIWFKVYIINTSTGKLSGLSKVVYIDVVGIDGLTKKIVLPVDVGMAAGQLTLSDSQYAPGNYRIRAYTKLMLNNGEDFYFDYTVRITYLSNNASSVIANSAIVQKSGAKSISTNGQSDGISLSIFPKGGSLISGLRSKVGIKAIGDDGLGILIKEHIENNLGEAVAVFETAHAGMGMFAILPKENETYTAVIENGPHQGKKFPMPPAKNEGYVLSINPYKMDTLQITVSRTNSLDAEKEIRLFIQAGGEPQLALKLPISNTSTRFYLPINKFKAGVNQVTLFSENNLPLAERLVFVTQSNEVETVLQSDKKQYGVRENVKINLLVSGQDKLGIVGGYSVSVNRMEDQQMLEEAQFSILSNLLLSSDLKENIENPNYYFIDETLRKRSELDLLMLTHGWRPFSWNEILIDSIKQKGFAAEQGLQISGSITNMAGKPIPNAKISLLASKEMLFSDTIADDNGRFAFDKLNFSDTATIILRARGEKEKSNVKIKIDEMPVVPFKLPLAVIQDSMQYNRKEASTVQVDNANIKQGVTLKTVEIVKKSRPEIKGSVYPFAAAPPDITIMPDKLQDIVDLTDYLRGRFAGVIVRGNKIFGTRGEMAILLNGFAIDDLSGINPRALTGVQIIRSGVVATNMATALMLDGSGGGIVFLTMGVVDAKYIKAKRPTGFMQKEFAGYTVFKEFYAPRYEVQKTELKSDFRSTLFWKPDIITGEDGKSAFDFFTSDEVGKYRISLEGIGENGQLIRKLSYFEVK